MLGSPLDAMRGAVSMDTKCKAAMATSSDAELYRRNVLHRIASRGRVPPTRDTRTPRDHEADLRNRSRQAAISTMSRRRIKDVAFPTNIHAVASSTDESL